MVGRPREFDRDEALRVAMDVFWRQGFEATQIDDLVAQMGIGRGSLYSAFGDKRALYLEALEAFVSRISASIRGRLLDGPDAPLDNLRAFIAAWPSMGAAGDKKGCFLTNSLIELGASDPEVAAIARRTLRAEELLYRGVLSEAQESGQLAKSRDVGMLARAIVNARLGVTLQARLGSCELAAEAAAATTLEMLT